MRRAFYFIFKQDVAIELMYESINKLNSYCENIIVEKCLSVI